MLLVLGCLFSHNWDSPSMGKSSCACGGGVISGFPMMFVDWCLSLTVSTPHCLHRWRCRVRLATRLAPPTVRFSVETMLAIIGPVPSRINVRISVSMSTKGLLDFDWNHIKSIDQFEKNWHLHYVSSSNPFRGHVSLLVFMFISFIGTL